MLRNLRDALTDIEKLAKAAGGKKTSVDIAAIRDLLNGEDDASVGDSIAELRNLIEVHKAEVQNAYVQQLIDAETDFILFNTLHARLSADKTIEKLDMDVIACKYTNGREKWKNRKLALDAIRDRFEERVYQAGKMDLIKEYKPG